jgi:hypothetical protein
MKAELLWVQRVVKEVPGRGGVTRCIYMRPITELPPGVRVVGLGFGQLEEYVDGAAVVQLSIGGVPHMLMPLAVGAAASFFRDFAFSGAKLAKHPATVHDLEVEIEPGRRDGKPPRVGVIVALPDKPWEL